jgi:diguanylate cyclase (GGDEF)-like protein
MSIKFFSSCGSQPNELPVRDSSILFIVLISLLFIFTGYFEIVPNDFSSVLKFGRCFTQASLLPYLLVVFSTAAAASLLSYFRSKSMEERLNVLHRLLEKCSRTIQDSNLKLSEANMRIENLERIDSLTGVANRRYFEEFLDREWRLAMRMSHPVSLLMIDIDSLKGTKSRSKVKVDEESLKKLAHAIIQTAKRPGDLAGRFAPREFAVVLAFTPLESAMQVAEKLRSAIAELQDTSDKPDSFEQVLINVGVATAVPTLGSEPEELIAKADKALHLARIDNFENDPVLH